MKSLVTKKGKKKKRKGTRREETRGDEYRPFLANELFDEIFVFFLGWEGMIRDDASSRDRPEEIRSYKELLSMFFFIVEL